MSCLICGQGNHRYGTTDPRHVYDAMACVNMLLGEVERLRAQLAEALADFEGRSLNFPSKVQPVAIDALLGVPGPLMTSPPADASTGGGEPPAPVAQAPSADAAPSTTTE